MGKKTEKREVYGIIDNSTDDSIIIGYDHVAKTNVASLIVARKNKNNKLDVINSFNNDDAIEMYEKLTGGNVKKVQEDKDEDDKIEIKYLIVGLIFVLGGSWLITCGIYKILTLCFGLPFDWGIATGLWIIGLIIKSLFK